MAASTPTLASSPPAPPGSATRLSLISISLFAVVAFALYAAYLASRVEEVIAPVEITVPTGGAVSPLGLGQTAPDFALTDIEGRTIKLSDFAGRPVWVNVWASWCAPCRAEMPDIDTAYRELRGSGLTLLMISLGEDPAAVKRYLGTVRYELPVLLDPTFAFTEKYRVSGLPTHYFIGRDGTLRDLAIGGLKPNGMRSRLTKLLAS